MIVQWVIDGLGPVVIGVWLLRHVLRWRPGPVPELTQDQRHAKCLTDIDRLERELQLGKYEVPPPDPNPRATLELSMLPEPIRRGRRSAVPNSAEVKQLFRDWHLPPPEGL